LWLWVVVTLRRYSITHVARMAGLFFVFDSN
jgi:hypothetical protein